MSNDIIIGYCAYCEGAIFDGEYCVNYCCSPFCRDMMLKTQMPSYGLWVPQDLREDE